MNRGISPTGTATRRAAVTVISSLAVFDAVIHLGGRVSIGTLVLELGRILPTTVVEGLIGILSLVTTYALFARANWARHAAISAHVFALVGVLAGRRAVTSSSRTYQALNVTYHEVKLAAVVTGLVLLLILGVRAALGFVYKVTEVKVRHA